MGKAEAGTPKYIANKIKAKGLQKLRWYCQMCQKQCRDENGFKCHTMSESHQRQLLIFADNSHMYLDQFSKEFSDGYMELLKRQFGTKRVPANKVYQDYIADRHHLHMNATKWLTLTDFVKWLGREGYCVVDETEKGWFVTYIDRDPETIALQEAIAKKEKMDKDDQDRERDFLAKQIRRGKKLGKSEETVYTELKREEGDKLSLNLKLTQKRKPDTVDIKPLSKALLTTSEYSRSKKSDKSTKDSSSTKKLSSLDEIMQREESRKKRMRRDHWLAEGIVVKVITNSLGEKYYKKKGVVMKVIDKYAAKVKMLDTEDSLKLDQAHLETVIPALGKSVLVLNGGYCGNEAILISIDEKHFSVSIEMKSGPLKGRKVDNVPYEDISKLSS